MSIIKPNVLVAKMTSIWPLIALLLQTCQAFIHLKTFVTHLSSPSKLQFPALPACVPTLVSSDPS